MLEQWPIFLRDWMASLFPEARRPIIAALIAAVTTVIVAASLFAALTLAERKILARFQNRIGPNRTGPFGLFQPLADAIKTCTKEDIVPASADRFLHFLAPVALVAFSLLTLAVIPFGRHLVPLDLECGILFFFAAGAGTELAVFLAGWSSRNKFALLSAMRALAQLISYELPLLLAAVPVVMLGGTLSTPALVAAQGGWTAGILPHWNVFTPWGAPAFLIFMIASLAETNRAPFDLPEAESELIAGHLTEYSGFKYALFFMAEYFGMLALCGMAVTLFLGGWHAPVAALEIVPSYVWFASKLFILLFGFMWIRATLLRLRIDQLTRLAWKFLVPLALVNLVTAAFWHLSAEWKAPWQSVRWLGAAALVVLPFVFLGQNLGAKRKPRLYRYAAE